MHSYSSDTLVNEIIFSVDTKATAGKAGLAMPELKSGGQTDLSPFLTTWGEGSGFIGRSLLSRNIPVRL